jgi:Rrf2 family protein
LACHPDKFIHVKHICKERNIPYSFLAKILQSLVKADIVRSTQGRNGGYQLERPAETISLYDIKILIDGSKDFEHCAFGRSVCSPQFPCSHHNIWSSIQAQILDFLQNTTLADLAVEEANNLTITNRNTEVGVLCK